MDPQIESQLRAAADQNQQQQQQPQPGAMPLDMQFFLQLFPILLQGTIQKSANAQDAISAAMVAAREAVGQYVVMGFCFPQTRLPIDGTLLAKVPNMPAQQQQGSIVGAATGHNPGNFVNQFPTIATQPVRAG